MNNHNHEQLNSSIIEHLANSISHTLNNKIIFSDPIEKNGITVIPVAKIFYGFGGGTGKQDEKKGNGGGCGIFAKPIGYIEIKDNKTIFVPISNPASSSSLIIASGITAYILLKGLAKFFRK